jgi:hypothetical protein
VSVFLKPAFLTIALVFCLATPAYALDVTLQWDANTETNLAGYKVYYKAGSSGGGILANYNGTGASEGDSPIDMSLALDENQDPGVVEFTVTGLTDGQTYYFVVTAYNDDVSPLESGPSNEEHTTAIPSDTTPPYATNRSPAPGATGVAVDTFVELDLRDAGVGVDQSTITMRVNGSPVTPSISGTSAAYTLSYNPPVDFAYDQTVSVEVDASDLNGNAMATDAYSFTTGPAPDTTPPYVTNRSPAPGASGVAISTLITFEIRDAGVGVDQSTIIVRVDGSSVIPSISGTAAAYTVSYNPNPDFAYDQTVLVELDASDLSGNAMATDAYSFTTGPAPDTTPPYATNRSPAPGATGVAINTSITLEVRDVGVGVDQSTITMTVNGSPVTPSISGTPAAYTVSYNPAVDFAYDQTVSLVVDASDLNGNAMATDVYSFTTGPAPDTTPPVISNVQATSITDNSAVIAWTTDEASDSAVQYGTTSGSYPLSRNSTTLVTSHSITLTGLNDDTTYFFRVRSTDGSGNGPTVSNELSFKTDPAPDTTAPTISNVQVTSITQTTAIISWTTNEPSNSEVQYDSARRPWGSYSWGENDNSLVTSHSITLTSLEADTTYYFRVGSTDGSGNGPTTSNQMSFTTEASPVPPNSPTQLKVIRTQ